MNTNEKVIERHFGIGLQKRPGKRCLTHHHACDCREELFEELVDENAKLQDRVEAAERLLHGIRVDDLARLSHYEQDHCQRYLELFWRRS